MATSSQLSQRASLSMCNQTCQLLFIHMQPSDTVLDYSFYPVHMTMARHIGVQYGASASSGQILRQLPPYIMHRYLPWAANSDPRFVSVPQRLASAPRNQQLRDSDFSLPYPLLRGLFSQGLQLSRCWSSAIQDSMDAFGATFPSLRFCTEDEAMYAGFEGNNWPKFELRWQLML